MTNTTKQNIASGAGATIGVSAGLSGTTMAVSSAGVSGLSAAGITSGLATIGGGTMLGGLTVITAGVGALAIAGLIGGKIICNKYGKQATR